MGSIADSDAVYDPTKILPQHLAALTLLNDQLQNPAVEVACWLDIACGKGQIIVHLNSNLPIGHRAKLTYVGYDINNDFIQTAQKTAESLNLKSAKFITGDLGDFSKLVPMDRKFDFITCTNTAHEMERGCFACLLLDALLRLSDSGKLFIYDMESLIKPELGALPWRKEEIEILIDAAFNALGTKFRPHAFGVPHSSVQGWTLAIQLEYIEVTNEMIIEKRNEISKLLDGIIDDILDSRLKECNNILEAFCKYRTITKQDDEERLNALYEFWALHRAKGIRS